MQFVLEIEPASFLSACDMRRATTPTLESPISRFNFAAAGHQGCNRVYNDHIHSAGANQRFRDSERIFASVRLGDEQALNVDPRPA